eukprot:13400564-Ditylum_brightwellii.AAC.1
MERMYILKLGKTGKLVNRRSEIYGACKQNLKLHGFNTDDPLGEKVETDRPILAAVRRYSEQQETSLSFT